MGRFEALVTGRYLGRSVTSLPLIPVRVTVAGESVMHPGMLRVSLDGHEVELSIRDHGSAHPVHGWAEPQPGQTRLDCEVEDLLLELVEEDVPDGLEAYAAGLLAAWNETVTRAAQVRHARDRAIARHRKQEAAARERERAMLAKAVEPRRLCGHDSGRHDIRGERVVCELPAGHYGGHVRSGVCVGPGPARTFHWPTDEERAAQQRHAQDERERERERLRQLDARTARCGHAYPGNAQLRCLLPPGHDGRHGGRNLAIGLVDWLEWPMRPAEPTMRFDRHGVLVSVPGPRHGRR